MEPETSKMQTKTKQPEKRTPRLPDISVKQNGNRQLESPPTKKEKAPKENETVTYVVIPPDGGWGWAVVIGAFFSYFISDGLLYSFGIFLKDISETFGCTKSKVSLAGAVNTCIFCISGPFSAALINRFSYRRVSVCGCVLASVSCVLTSFSSSINLVIFFHGVLGGIGFGMIYITAVVVVGFYFERWRAIATGFAVCGAGVGEISLPPLFTFLLNKMGWRNTFRILGAMTLMLIVCSCLFRPLKATKVLVVREPSKIPSVGKPATPFGKHHSKLIDGKISTVTILEPMKNSHSELIATITYSTGSSSSAEHIEESSTGPERIKCKCCKCRNRCKGCCRSWSTTHTKGVLIQPMLKEDIFYGGSIVDLSEYKQSLPKPKILNLKSSSNVEYQLSTTRTFFHPGPKERTKCAACSSIIKQALCSLLDFKIIRNVNFALFNVMALLTAAGFYTPYMFIKDTAIAQGISPNLAFWFVSTMGLTNTLGRICCGLLTTIPCISASVLSYCLLFTGGVATILSTMCYKIWVQFLYCAVYGFCVASMSALKTVILVNLLGLENLTNAIGIILLFQGMATLIGISISGYLKDFTGDYKCSFYFGGTLIWVGAIFLFALDMKTRYKKSAQV